MNRLVTWNEATLLRVAALVEEGKTTGQIGVQLGLPYRVARHYVRLVERRLALPYVYVRRTRKKAPAPTGA